MNITSQKPNKKIPKYKIIKDLPDSVKPHHFSK